VAAAWPGIGHAPPNGRLAHQRSRTATGAYVRFARGVSRPVPTSQQEARSNDNLAVSPRQQPHEDSSTNSTIEWHPRRTTAVKWNRCRARGITSETSVLQRGLQIRLLDSTGDLPSKRGRRAAAAKETCGQILTPNVRRATHVGEGRRGRARSFRAGFAERGATSSRPAAGGHRLDLIGSGPEKVTTDCLTRRAVSSSRRPSAASICSGGALAQFHAGLRSRWTDTIGRRRRVHRGLARRAEQARKAGPGAGRWPSELCREGGGSGADLGADIATRVGADQPSLAAGGG